MTQDKPAAHPAIIGGILFWLAIFLLIFVVPF